jgi:hypothetical protein
MSKTQHLATPKHLIAIFLHLGEKIMLLAAEFTNISFKISVYWMFHFCSSALHIRFKQQAALRG